LTVDEKIDNIVSLAFITNDAVRYARIQEELKEKGAGQVSGEEFENAALQLDVKALLEPEAYRAITYSLLLREIYKEVENARKKENPTAGSSSESEPGNSSEST
jgi:hypothetical protein